MIISQKICGGVKAKTFEPLASVVEWLISNSKLGGVYNSEKRHKSQPNRAGDIRLVKFESINCFLKLGSIVGGTFLLTIYEYDGFCIARQNVPGYCVAL